MEVGFNWFNGLLKGTSFQLLYKFGDRGKKSVRGVILVETARLYKLARVYSYFQNGDVLLILSCRN